ncbi:MAG: imidazoleglycerol-phosphate dehydratase HisB [Rhodobacteraceae bacterium]|nr:imidazoleglycerol-phosphate dehydratase HisB [Paracoccaceae bacterium]
MAERERTATLDRTTGETSIIVSLTLDGAGDVAVRTGIGMFDHMLHALALHAGWDLTLTCEGDLNVDDHHSIEDTGLVLGQALADAIGPDRADIVRFGSAYAPLDEALARAVADVSGRPHFSGSLHLKRDRVGSLSCEMVPHFFRSLAQTAGLTLHIDVIRGVNDHHRIEASFKALALALRSALATTDDQSDIRSTKGVL